MQNNFCDYDDPRHVFHEIKISLNALQIQKDDVDVKIRKYEKMMSMLKCDAIVVAPKS